MESIGAGHDLRPGVSGPNASPATVLVVDDLDANIQLLERLLVREGHRVLVSRDGGDAIAHRLKLYTDQLNTDESVILSLGRGLIRAFERIAARLQVSHRAPHLG